MAHTRGGHVTRRRLLQGAALGIGFPMLNFASFRLFADSPATYSARAVALVERSLVIDMLAVMKINFLPEAYANPLTEAEIAAFKGCGITGFNNAIGTGGPAAVEETLSFLAAWQGSARGTPTSSASWTPPPTSTAPRLPASAP